MSTTTRTDEALVVFIRTICAKEFERSYDYPFFRMSYEEGESADVALVRIFKAERQHQDSDSETVLVMCHG